MGTSCFICLLLLEMTALRLKGPSLALIDLGIYSEPLGSFYTPANSMATICPYHYPHHGPISESGSRIREGRENGKRWFGWCLWFPLLLPFPSLQPSFSESHAWLIMEQSCSPLICVCHMQLWWIICDGATGAHGHSAPWLCLPSASAESMACPGRAKRRQKTFAEISLPFPLKLTEIQPTWMALSEAVYS